MKNKINPMLVNGEAFCCSDPSDCTHAESTGNGWLCGITENYESHCIPYYRAALAASQEENGRLTLEIRVLKGRNGIPEDEDYNPCEVPDMCTILRDRKDELAASQAKVEGLEKEVVIAKAWLGLSPEKGERELNALRADVKRLQGLADSRGASCENAQERARQLLRDNVPLRTRCEKLEDIVVTAFAEVDNGMDALVKHVARGDIMLYKEAFHSIKRCRNILGDREE